MATRVEQQTVDYESLNKNDKDLKNLIKEIDELKDNDLHNDKIEGGVLLENNLNKSLDKTLRHCDKKILNALVTEVGKINLSEWNVEWLNTLVAALNTIKVSRETESLAKFRTKITSWQLDDLNHLDKEDIQNVLDCIDGMSRSDVLKLYSDMTVALQSQHNNFKSTDQKYFYSVYEKIENKVNDGKPLQLNESDVTDAELREIFYDGLQASRLWEIFKQYTTGTGWEWWNIDESFTLKKSETQRFTAKEFADKFNEANGKRIEGVNTEVNKLIDGANIDWITVNSDGKFMKPEQEITIEAILGITDKSIIGAQDADGKDLNILKVDELGRDHFKDKRAERTKALTEKINKAKSDAEAAANAERSDLLDKEKASSFNEMKSRIDAIGGIAGELKPDRPFIRVNEDDKSYSYNFKEAKNYLTKLSGKSWNEFPRYYDKTGERYAWVSAMQIALNKINWDDKIQVDGILWTETKTKLEEIQSKYGVWRGVNWYQSWPNTIKALLAELDKATQSETVVPNGERAPAMNQGAEGIDSSKFFNGRAWFSFVENLQNRDNLGIDNTVLGIYKKDGEGNNLYYQSGNDIVRVSTDTPWIKQKQELDDSMTLNDDEWTSDVNVCKEWESKLNAVLKTLSITWEEITISTDNNQYVFENWNTKIQLNDILTRDFCDKNTIDDKMNLVYYASFLKNNKNEKIVDTNKIQFENSLNNNPYWLDDWNKDQFIQFYNKLFEQNNTSV